MPPMRGRELKHPAFFDTNTCIVMPPMRGRELKHTAVQLQKCADIDAPYAGARIETSTI